MGLFDFILKKKEKHGHKKSNEPENPNSFFEEKLEDFLYKGVTAKQEAIEAISNEQFDDAWRLLHDAKTHFLNHAKENRFSAKETIAIDGSIHEYFANILRLEKKHTDAFVSLIYWVTACSNNPIKRHDQKLNAYFNRCKFKNTSLEDVRLFMSSLGQIPDHRSIQAKVLEWKDKG